MNIETPESELEKIITANVNGTTAVSCDTVTEVRMVKKHRETKEPNPYIGAVKVQTKNGLIGFDYENSVNNQAKREEKETRESQQRAWGTLSDNRIFVYHKGNTYLQLKVQNVTDTKYFLNGKEIPESEIKPFLSGNGKSSTQKDLDKEIIVNDIKFSSIQKIRMQKSEITVIH